MSTGVRTRLRWLGRGRPSTVGGTRLSRGQKALILFAVIPAVAHFAFESYIPIGYAFYMSLHDWHLLGGREGFVGLSNYQNHVADPLFWKVLQNTMIYAFATVFGGTILGFTVAVLMHPLKYGSPLLRVIYYLPALTHVVAITSMWTWILQPRFGLVNAGLRALNLPTPGWFGEVGWAMVSLIIMSYWGGLGGSVIIFYAGLQGVPQVFYEAAAIDGASALQKVWHITIPMVRPVFTFVLVTGLIGGFAGFTSVFLTSGGGPLDSTRVLGLRIYDLAFGRLWIGQAASLAFILFAIVFTLTLIQLRISKMQWQM